MEIDGVPIKLDEAADGTLYEPEHWRKCPHHFGIMHHLPTGSQYFVVLPEESRKQALVSIFDFQASLVYLPDEESMPSWPTQQSLGRAAIAVFLQETGLWRPEVIYV